jgi:predicted kinase
MNNQTVYLTIGAPASGKSTWAISKVHKSPTTTKRLNKDDIRNMIHGGIFQKDIESDVMDARDQLLRLYLESGYDVIIDDTNGAYVHESRIRHIVASEFPHVKVEVIIFDTPLDECILRDSLRDKSVGEGVVRKIHKQIEDRYMTNMEIDSHKWPSIPAELNSVDTTRYATHCGRIVIVDIDGTLAEMTDRGPFDWMQVWKDVPKMNVVRVVNSLRESGHYIVVMSGRSDICREMTEDWLRKYITYNELHMRKDGDNRKDYIVKREIFMREFNPDDILCVIDDRKQVVEMWRTHFGLTVLQVEKGNF